jgi:hypothetical protein
MREVVAGPASVGALAQAAAALGKVPRSPVRPTRRDASARSSGLVRVGDFPERGAGFRRFWRGAENGFKMLPRFMHDKGLLTRTAHTASQPRGTGLDDARFRF